MRRLAGLFLATVFFAVSGPSARAEELYCEVMAVEGTATVTNQSESDKALQEGDLLKAEDVVQVGAGSSLDLAYDRDWNNVTRVEENSKIRIRSVYPAEMELASGGVYAKLKSLPKDSSFSVSTPTAIASVRGTEYRTTFLEGETQVYNVSDSDVSVYGLDAAGQRQAAPIILRRSEKTQVIRRGQAPVAPRRMEAQDLKRAEHFQQGLEKKIKENVAKGRIGKTLDVQAIEKVHLEKGPEDEGAEPRRNVPKILSGDEAHQAVQNVVGGGEEPLPPVDLPDERPAEETHSLRSEEGSSRLLKSPGAEGPSEPAAEPDKKGEREFTDAELGPAPNEQQLQQAFRQVQDDKGNISADKVNQLRKKVEEAIENSPPEQKEMLKKMQRQVNETVKKVLSEQQRQAAQNGSAGQPFGPDLGRKPQNGKAEARPASKSSNRK